MRISSCYAGVVAAAPATLMVVAGLMACSGARVSLGGSADADTAVYGPTGRILTLQIKAGSDGSNLSVTLTPEPSTIVVNPTSLITDADGNAAAFALVAYGTEGVVVVSALGATAGSIPVSSDPISLCQITALPETGGGDFGPAGQVYAVSVQAVRSGACADGVAAPAGISLMFAVVQPSGTPPTSSATGSGVAVSNAISSATVFTDRTGVANANLLIPWGANALVQVAGGGAVASTSVAGLTSPVSINCLSWSLQQSGLYALTAKVVASSGTTVEPMPATTINFSVIAPAPGAGTVAPSQGLTDDTGVATVFVAIPNPNSLPVIVEAMTGSAALTTSIGPGTTGESGSCTP
jgi:hypothetical protein